MSNRPNPRHPIDPHLEALLLRQRGPNGPLVREVLAYLSPESRERLYRVLQDLVDNAEAETRKRKRGQFW